MPLLLLCTVAASAGGISLLSLASLGFFNERVELEVTRRPVDTTLTPPQAQPPTVRGKAQKRKPFRYAGIASPCNTQQPLTAHS